MPPETSDRVEKQVKDWADILWGVIPAERLDECFRAAYRNHTPGRIFEAAAVTTAWKSISASGISPTARAPNCSLCTGWNEADLVAQKYLAPCPFHQQDIVRRLLKEDEKAQAEK